MLPFIMQMLMQRAASPAGPGAGGPTSHDTPGSGPPPPNPQAQSPGILSQLLQSGLKSAMTPSGSATGAPTQLQPGVSQVPASSSPIGDTFKNYAAQSSNPMFSAIASLFK